jgi:hypothetical protein
VRHLIADRLGSHWRFFVMDLQRLLLHPLGFHFRILPDANGGGLIVWVDPSDRGAFQHGQPHPAPAVGAEVWVPVVAENMCSVECAESREVEEYGAVCRNLDHHEGEVLGGHTHVLLRATVTALGARRWCPACGGRGFDEEEADTCFKCDGEGRKMACPDDLCRGAGECIHPDGYVSCGACKGLGEVYDPCPTCQGTPPWWATVTLKRMGA